MRLRVNLARLENDTIAKLSCYRETLTALKPTLNLEKLPLFIFVNKGIEAGTRALTLEIIADTCGNVAARNASFIVSTEIPIFLSFFNLLTACRLRCPLF